MKSLGEFSSDFLGKSLGDISGERFAGILFKTEIIIKQIKRLMIDKKIILRVLSRITDNKNNNSIYFNAKNN